MKIALEMTNTLKRELFLDDTLLCALKLISLVHVTQFCVLTCFNETSYVVGLNEIVRKISMKTLKHRLIF